MVQKRVDIYTFPFEDFKVFFYEKNVPYSVMVDAFDNFYV